MALRIMFPWGTTPTHRSNLVSLLAKLGVTKANPRDFMSLGGIYKPGRYSNVIENIAS